MAGKNGTIVMEFFLTVFSEHREWGLPLFLVLLSFHLLTLLGITGTVFLIHVDGRLYTSIYFFPGPLSLVDICYSSHHRAPDTGCVLEHRAVLYYTRCNAQFFLFTFFASINCYLLAIMTYDCYMAVYWPLLYVTIMTE